MPSRNPVSRLVSVPSLHTSDASTTNSTGVVMEMAMEGNENLPGNAKRKLHLEAPLSDKESTENDHGVKVSLFLPFYFFFSIFEPCILFLQSKFMFFLSEMLCFFCVFSDYGEDSTR